MTETSNEHRKRGERLNPKRSQRTFWVLQCIKHELGRAIKKHISRKAERLRIIDYGCGNMPYRSLFEALGASYEGHDFPSNDIAHAALRENGGLAIESGTADVVISSQVLEHVPDPSFYLFESRRVLKTGGKMFLTTHGVWRYHPDPTDFWRWTSDGLRKVVEEAGFRIIEFKGIIGSAATGIQLWQDAVVLGVPARLQGVLCYLCQRAMEFCDRRTAIAEKDKDASVFLCVACKGENVLAKP